MTSATVHFLEAADTKVVRVDTGIDRAASTSRYHLARIQAHLCAIVALLREGRAGRRVLYVGGAGGYGLWYQLVVVAVGSLLGYRIVFHHHSFAYLGRRTLSMQLLVRVPLRGGCHIALCGGMAHALKELYRTRVRIEVLSNAEILALPTPRHHAVRRHNRTIVLGHLSNLTVEKGLDEVLRTLDVLLRAGIPALLLLAGPTQSAAASALVAQATDRFGASLQYLGAIAPGSVSEFMSQVDLFLFPSRNEAEPLVVLEAIDAGVPVVTFDVGCLKEIVGPGDAAMPPDADFAAAVLELASQLLVDADLSANAHGLAPRAVEQGVRRDRRKHLARVLIGGEERA